MLVVDASQGGMAVESARVWSEDVGVSSLILTKLDGTAKGGSVIAVSKELGIPVKLVGVGEKIEDLKDFNADYFIVLEKLDGIDSGKIAVTARDRGAVLDVLGEAHKVGLNLRERTGECGGGCAIGVGRAERGERQKCCVGHI